MPRSHRTRGAKRKVRHIGYANTPAREMVVDNPDSTLSLPEFGKLVWAMVDSWAYPGPGKKLLTQIASTALGGCLPSRRELRFVNWCRAGYGYPPLSLPSVRRFSGLDERIAEYAEVVRGEMEKHPLGAVSRAS